MTEKGILFVMLQFGTMLKRRREYDCTTGSTECNKPQDLVDTLEEQFGYLNTSGQGVWSELSKEVASKLSKSVFAIASFDGNFLLVYVRHYFP
jgi:hypothetical protein